VIPLGDDNPLLRRPVLTIALLLVMAGTFIFIQAGGFDRFVLASTICNYGLVPGELTRRAPEGLLVPLGESLACVVDRQQINLLTPLTSIFLHGGWGHLLGNAIFLWVFGRSVEDSMGRFRFLAFFLICGVAAAFTHVLVDPASPIPTVGASGAISGVLGAYLVLYPRSRVRMLFIFIIFIRVIVLPAYVVLLAWIAFQLLAGVPQLGAESATGVAFWAHIGGFFTGVVLARLFADRSLVLHRALLRQRFAPRYP
jgi:membrane associated rhomboid family serine protease